MKEEDNLRVLLKVPALIIEEKPVFTIEDKAVKQLAQMLRTLFKKLKEGEPK